MSAAMREIVASVWTEHIGVDPDWTPQQTQEFFDAEARRLSVRINALAAEQAMVNIAAWKSDHGGRDPDYLTHVGLINNARAQVQEIVLAQEVYELVPPEEEDTEEYQQAAQAAYEAAEEAAWEASRSDPERWRGTYRTPSTEETDDTLTVFWPQRTIQFRVMAGLLWQAREEDGLPLPRYLTGQATQHEQQANEQLIAELTAMVEDYLRERNLHL